LREKEREEDSCLWGIPPEARVSSLNQVKPPSIQMQRNEIISFLKIINMIKTGATKREEKKWSGYYHLPVNI
jgi:hypothetical protein